MESDTAESISLRVFLSYGHDEYADVALGIREVLRQHGHQVWLDEERLSAGGDWQQSIEAGLDWVSEDLERGRVVLVMTPHSVRRPDGYCLNELTRALERRIPVVPVMVVWVEPPLSICNLQWLDMTLCVPIGEKQELFTHQANALMDALEQGEVPLVDARSWLRRTLRPISFDAELRAGIEGYVDRQWVTDAFTAWVSNPSGPTIRWLTGGPGTGKTTLSLWLAATRQEVGAWHFCQFGNAVKADSRRAVMSIAYQLATQFPEYESRLLRLATDELVNGERNDARVLFDTLVLQPLATMPKPDHTVVVIVDGLDEASVAGRNELAELFSTNYLGPSWLRFWITSRAEEPITHLMRGAARLDLNLGADATSADVQSYLDVRTLFSRGLVDIPGGDLPEILDRLALEAKGSFLWAKSIIGAARAGQLDVRHPEGLPGTLAEVYWRLFRRQFPDLAEYRRRVRPLLEVVAAQSDSLSLDVVTELLGWSPYDRREILAEIGSLTVQSDGGLRPFHASLVEWLTDAEAAGEFWVDAVAGKRHLAEVVLRRIDTGQSVEGLVAMGTVTTLVEGGSIRDAARLCADRTYLASRLLLDTDDFGARRDARKAHAEDILALARRWPADWESSPITECVVAFVLIGWKTIANDGYRQDYDLGKGILTTGVTLVDELASVDQRWIPLIPTIVTADTGSIGYALRLFLSSTASEEGRRGDATRTFLYRAVEDVVTRWSVHKEANLGDWAAAWTPMPNY